MSTPIPVPSACPRQSRGFALLITITLLAFLVLLLVSLAALTRVETQVANNNQSLAQARQNALLALNIALGQLQKHTGPDQRVTTTADVLIPSGVTIDASADGAFARTQVDAYWNGARRNRRWTGAWFNDNNTAYLADNPVAYNPLPSVSAWLVSGNETTATFDPTDRVTGLTVASTPLNEILDSAGRPHRLLVKASAGATTANTLHRAVTAPQIAIESNAVPGVSGLRVVGHYAWWVGDEGVKARVNLADAYVADGSDEGLLRRRSAAQRLAIEAMATGGTGLATYPINDDSLSDVISYPQLDLLVPDGTWRDATKDHYHDLTIWSRGVLSDTRHGGLKRDLSYLLGQPSTAAFRTALNAAYDGGGAALLGTYNPALTAVASPYATVPSEPDSGGAVVAYNSAPGIMGYGPTWEQLRSFHNMGNLTPAGAFETATVAIPRLQTGDQQGLYPLLIQAKLFYRLRIVNPDSGDYIEADGANRTGKIWVDTIPVIVLANPYNVDLGAADYTVRFFTNNLSVRFATPASDPPTPEDFASATQHAISTTGYTGKVQLVLRSNGFKAGEAQIFTVDPDSSVNPTIDSDDRVEIVHATSDTKQIFLKNDFDPTPALTYNTNLSIPSTPPTAPPTHVALYSSISSVEAKLYLDYDATVGDERLIQFIRGQSLFDSTNTVTSQFFLVDPIQDGRREGGGFILVLNEAPTSATPLTPVDRRPQQAPFYQVNYRGFTNYALGYTGGGTIHLNETARTYVKSGSTADTAANLFLEANLLRPSGDMRTTRWGLVNIGANYYQTDTPGYIDDDTGFINLLYDLPRPGQPLSSLGQLRHFNTAGHIPVANLLVSNEVRYSVQVHQWQVNYPIGNSYPHPRVPRDRVFNSTLGMGYHYDGSYIWNDVLWDRFFLSAYPQSDAFDFDADDLVNARLRPFRDRNEVPWDKPVGFRGNGDPAIAANSRRAAQNLLVEGAFNINSTSRDAWKAVFASLRNVPVGNEPAGDGTTSPNLTAPFARTLYQTGGADGSKAANTAPAWNGIRNLTDGEVDALADEMVLQVRRRGPFLSLAEFVNRRLVASADDTHGLGLAGALQAAIDKVLNKADDIADEFAVKSMESSTRNQIADPAYLMPTAVSGFPGYLLQGDVLSVLGSSLTARSDTFVIRTYGDATNPVTLQVEGRAWCEAVVQRTPDYVVSKNGAVGNAPHETASDPDNIAFGRRYEIVSFRWLTPDDL